MRQRFLPRSHTHEVRKASLKPLLFWASGTSRYQSALCPHWFSQFLLGRFSSVFQKTTQGCACLLRKGGIDTQGPSLAVSGPPFLQGVGGTKDPITELFEPQGRQPPPAVPRVGAQEASVLCSQIETSEEPARTVPPSTQSEISLISGQSRLSSLVPGRDPAVSLGAGTTLSGSPTLRKRGCPFVSTIFVSLVLFSFFLSFFCQ